MERNRLLLSAFSEVSSKDIPFLPDTIGKE
jgi:hypothetical protein